MIDITQYLQIERGSDQILVRIVETPAPELFAQIVDKVYELATDDVADVQLDVGGVEFIPSMSLGALVALDKRIEAVGGKLTLRRPSPALCELLEITGLERVFTVVRE